jgi:alpha-L-rhamnosidase
VQVTGLDEAPPLDAITGIVVHSQMDRTGTFECSNPLINQLFKNIIWGQKGNYFDIPTDCPQRDERLGWTGDAQFFVPTASYNFDIAAFFNKWLYDLCEDSADDEGAFPSVAPNVLGKGSFGATAWADAGIICPYTIWKMYGDTTVIRDHYAAMGKYIDYLKKTSDHLIRKQGAYGDWLNLGGGAKSEVIGTAYFEHVTRLMAEMATATGKSDDAATYAALADDVRLAFIKEFVTDDGRIRDSSQTGYVLAFAFHLLPDVLRAQAADAFVEEIKNKDWHLATGFIGTPRLLPALSLAGRDDVAYRLLEQETYPGWLYQVKLGATTMWERWDGWTPDKGFQDPGMNSFNHYAFGSVGEWLYRTVGGIDSESDAFKEIVIRPHPGGHLTWAKATYNSIHGKIESSWKLQNGKLTLDVTVPLNTTATIFVPSSDPSHVVEAGGAKASQLLQSTAVYKVGSGRYHFTAKSLVPSP